MKVQIAAIVGAVFASSGHAVLLTESAARSTVDAKQRIISDPVRTEVENISDAELTTSDMERHNLKSFDVSVYIYKSEDWISKILRENGDWEPDGPRTFCDVFKMFGGKGNMFDLGGNIGTWTLPLADCLQKHGKGGNKVITVEGASWNAKHLRAGIKYNNALNVHLYEYIVTSPEGDNMKEMVHDPGNEGGSHVTMVRGKRDLLPATTIDSIAHSEAGSLQNVLAMKIDIEGHEDEAFLGAGEFFKNPPCMIFMEISHSNNKKFMEDLGYAVVDASGFIDPSAWCFRKDFIGCIANLH